MQLLNTSQIQAWDEYTIRHEPIASIDLMERAARACYDWLLSNGYQEKGFSIYCGKGNNGGDGLAIARMLANSGHEVFVYILEFGHKGTDDFQHNLALLHETNASIHFISSSEMLREVNANHVIIDALLGTGLNRYLEGLTASVVEHINKSGAEIISIDIPTGLFADSSGIGNMIVKATHTLSFQVPKLSFLFNESQPSIGELHILDIHLHAGFLDSLDASFFLTDVNDVKRIIRKRNKYSHKGDYGNGALIVGSEGMVGAATLCARAFMRTGAGKLTCHVPQTAYTIMQMAVPEAMCKVEKGEHYLKSIGALDKYDAIGIGPGWGLHDSHEQLLEEIFTTFNRPIVIDADALNMLSRKKSLLKKIPALSILTPHAREFERLFGTMHTDYERVQKALEKSAELNIIIVLKGPNTFIATPSGKGYFNSTGNPGMATAGSGDVLTGIISSLLCQGYASHHAAVAGVFLHGLSGDLAASVNSQEALIASDIIAYLGQAFKQIL